MRDLERIFICFILVITFQNVIVLRVLQMIFLKIKYWLEGSPSFMVWLEKKLCEDKSVSKCWYCKYVVYSIMLKLESGITLRPPKRFCVFYPVILFLIVYRINKELLIEGINYLKSNYDKIIDCGIDFFKPVYSVIAEWNRVIIGIIVITVILFYYCYGCIRKKTVKKVIEQMDELYKQCDENIYDLTIMGRGAYIDYLVDSITDYIGFELQDGVLMPAISKGSGRINDNQNLKRVSVLLKGIKECFLEELDYQFLMDSPAKDDLINLLKKDEIFLDNFWENEENKKMIEFFKENHNLIYKKKISGVRVIREDRIQNLDCMIEQVEKVMKMYQQGLWSYQAKNLFLKIQIQKKREKMYLLFYIPNIFMRGINIYFYIMWNLAKFMLRFIY